jgi:hypothetical protein
LRCSETQRAIIKGQHAGSAWLLRSRGALATMPERQRAEVRIGSKASLVWQRSRIDAIFPEVAPTGRQRPRLQNRHGRTAPSALLLPHHAVRTTPSAPRLPNSVGSNA